MGELKTLIEYTCRLQLRRGAVPSNAWIAVGTKTRPVAAGLRRNDNSHTHPGEVNERLPQGS